MWPIYKATAVRNNGDCGAALALWDVYGATSLSISSMAPPA